MMHVPFHQIAPLIVILSALGIGGWVVTTAMRIKHGYPLEGHRGQAIYPKASDEAERRIEAMSAENAQLRTDLAAIKTRLATVERIVTDDGHRLTQEIESLRLPTN